MNTTKHDLIARMREHDAERAYLLAVLNLWVQAETQGIDPETVKSFGFSLRFCKTERERREARTWKPTRDDDGCAVVRSPVFNFVSHHDGTQTRLNPPLKAIYREDFGQ